MPTARFLTSASIGICCPYVHCYSVLIGSANNTGNERSCLPSGYYERYVSDSAKARKPSPIHDLLPLEFRPGMISLLAGKPNPDTFPFKSISITAQDPQDYSKALNLSLDPSLLAAALQYGPTNGLPRFVQWLTALQEREHGRVSAEEEWRISVGTGSMDLINKALITMINPGDAVLIEKPVYASTITLFESLQADLVDISTDAQGIQSEHLEAVLDNWPIGNPKPKVLYTIPYGGNPAGTTASLERRRHVLALARKHDFLILEDDPYYYLYFGDDSRPPSYFALEKEDANDGEPLGCVLRFDSLSKILSAGMRIGFVSGPVSLLNNIDQNTQTANLQSSQFSQAVALTLLESWGYDGFKAHTRFVSDFYRKRRDEFERAMRRYLGGMVEWNSPCAGMFIWFKLLLNHPSDADGEECDSEQLIRTQALENGVLALPGTVFLPNGGPTPYVRASFSLLDEETTNEAMRRLRKVVLEARGRERA